MKKIILLPLFLLGFWAMSQNSIQSGFGEFKFNQAKTPCLTKEQHDEISAQLDQSAKLLQAEGKLLISPKAPPPKFIWPVRKSATAPYENVWSISNHVDHDLNYPNQLKDWNCGTRTYDTADGYNHQGIDIFTWPFTWFQFENNQAEIIAAADGVIIYKSDGNFDKNCAFNSSNWNAVYVQHSDGSRAWYGHMKKNSLTPKPVGAAVVAGEYLGIIGSSGNSTGPHLHFEVYDSNNQLVDTYQGPCNDFVSGNNSWWQVQKPYEDPKINAVLTHTAAPDFGTCPDSEITYQKDDFGGGSNVVAAVYLADQKPGMIIGVQLIRPNGTVAFTTNINSSVFYAASFWFWNFPAGTFNMNGNWKFSATAAGQTVTHNFTYGILNTQDHDAKSIEIFPNPTKDFLNIQGLGAEKIQRVSAYDASGKMVSLHAAKGNQINVSELQSGSYVLMIQTDQKTYKKKFIKK